MGTVNININLEVTVKLTDFGMDIFDDYKVKSLNKLRTKYGFAEQQIIDVKEIIESWLNKDTKILKVQLWRIIDIFGKYMENSMGSNFSIFEDNNISINTRELSIYNDLRF